MAKRNYFWIILVLFALAAGAVLLMGVFDRLEREEETAAPGRDDIERVKNLLENYSFEEEFSGGAWKINAGRSGAAGYDDIIKSKGNYSIQLSLEEGSDSTISLIQIINNASADKRYSLFGAVKAEDADSLRLEIKLFYNDSLLISGYSNSLSGTTDWIELSSWLKTYVPDSFDEKKLIISVEAVLFGKGRAWIDNMRLYSIPAQESIYDYDYNPFSEKNGEK